MVYRMNSYLVKSLRQAKRWIIAIIGFTILLMGIAMIVLPGPAFVVIPAGLAILGTEFIWARNFLNKVKDRLLKLKDGGIPETK